MAREQSSFDTRLGDKITVGNISDSVAAIGAGAQVIYNKVERALTGVEQTEQAMAFEHRQLAESVTAYVRQLEQQASKASDAGSYKSPYKALLDFDFHDAAAFYGRAAAQDAVLTRLGRDALTVVHGESGAGLTSLLKAGIMPQLLADGHVPLYVRPYETSVPQAVKNRLVGQLEQTPQLAADSLHDFLKRATDLLGGGWLVVVLDQMEELFTTQNAEDRNAFVDALAPCLDDDFLPVRWLLALRGDNFGQLGTFQPQIRSPFANEFLLPPLSRAEAQEAIVKPAAELKVTFEDGLVNTLLDDLGPDEISPPQLQLVCATLYDSRAGSEVITQAILKKQNGVSGLLGQYLDNVLSREVPADQRDMAWEILESLVSRDGQRVLKSRAEIARLLIGEDAATLKQLLERLVDSHLARLTDDGYQVSSDSLVPRILEKAAERAALQKARAEAVRQFEQMRNSALRGLAGGAVGFSLAYIFTAYSGLKASGLTSLLPLLVSFRLAPGAVAGFLMVLSSDLAGASYSGSRRWRRWLVTALAGGLSFALALGIHAYLANIPGTLLAMLPELLEGFVWGVVMGLGMEWVNTSRRPVWLTLAGATFAGALTLWFADNETIIGDAFETPQPAFMVALAGAIVPLCVIGGSLLFKPRETFES